MIKDCGYCGKRIISGFTHCSGCGRENLFTAEEMAEIQADRDLKEAGAKVTRFFGALWDGLLGLLGVLMFGGIACMAAWEFGGWLLLIPTLVLTIVIFIYGIFDIFD
jgi:hypothetical protein